MGLPIRADSEDFQRSNTKIFEVLPGSITLQVNKVDQQTGEIAGFFESIQPSDTEFGAKEPLEVKIQGVFYARLETETA
jgi:photosystem II oxygen-evolving enhancer protein 1